MTDNDDDNNNDDDDDDDDNNIYYNNNDDDEDEDDEDDDDDDTDDDAVIVLTPTSSSQTWPSLTSLSWCSACLRSYNLSSIVAGCSAQLCASRSDSFLSRLSTPPSGH